MSLNITHLLSKPDLTQNSNHAIGLIVDEIKQALQIHYQEEVKIERGSITVSLEDNYYALGYAKDEITLSSVYTRYIDEKTLLRTQMSSVIPSLLRRYKASDKNCLWMCPGIVYRRDVRDRTHIGEPHQLDIWYLNKSKHNRESLLELVQILINIIEKYKNKPVKWRYHETQHNYTEQGIEVEIQHNGQWLELLECGLISQELLNKHQIENQGGLALGLGLERLVMVIKNITDIRALYSSDALVSQQMLNLKPYKEVSKQPAIKRDLSIALSKSLSIESVTEKIMDSPIIQNKEWIESIVFVNETDYESLPSIAIERLGMTVEQKNMLLRITLRSMTQTLTSEQANKLYESIYSLIHENEIGYA